MGRFSGSGFEPAPYFAGAMDETHDKYFKNPDVREDTTEEKISYVFIGIIAAAATVTAAVLVPMALNDKL